MLHRQFIQASIVETLKDVWAVTVVYSYYGLYNFTESQITSSRNDAMLWLLKQRCENRLSVVDVSGVNIDITKESK